MLVTCQYAARSADRPSPIGGDPPFEEAPLMSIRFTCPQCGARLRADAAALGHVRPCAQCKEPIRVPGDPAAPAVAAPPPAPSRRARRRVLVAAGVLVIGGAVGLGAILSGGGSGPGDRGAPGSPGPAARSADAAPALTSAEQAISAARDPDPCAGREPHAAPDGAAAAALDAVGAAGADRIAPETRIDDTHRAFDLAALLSAQRYWTDVDDVKTIDADAPLRLLTGAALLRESAIPAVRACGEALERGRLCAERETQRVLDRVAQSRERAATILERAIRGELSSEREHLSVSQDRHGNTRLLSSASDGGEAGFAVITSQSLSILRGLAAPAMIEGKVAACMRASQPPAWTALLEGAEDRYAAAPIVPRLVEPVIVRDSAGVHVLGFTNVSGMDLTRVLVRCDLYHFQTFPYCESAHVIAVESWPRDQTVHVAKDLARNLALTEAQIRQISRPSSAEPWKSDAREVQALKEIAGLVATGMAAWSEQGVMPYGHQRFPDQALAAGRFDLAWMYALADRHPWGSRSTDRLLGFLPEGTDEARLVAALRDDPDAALRDWRSRRTDEILARVPQGAVFRGTMRFRMKSLEGNEDAPRTRDGMFGSSRADRSRDRHGHTEHWTLTIIGQDATSRRVTAMARMIGDARVQQRFEGTVQPTGSPHAFLLLEPSPERVRTMPDLDEIGRDMLSGRFNLVVMPGPDGSLVGHSATHGSRADEFGYVFELLQVK